MDRLASSPPRRTAATALSGRAWPLVPAVLALSAADCLITSTPQFQAPQHTRPFLVASTASPSLYDVVVVDSANPGSKVFSADVISQDDPAGGTGKFQQVQAVLFIDYGLTVPMPPGAPAPYQWAINSSTSLDPGTLDQTIGRQVSVSWSPQAFPVSPGCHTATLVVSHQFERNPECPSCEDDFSTLTWQILRCDSTMTGDCDNLPVAGSAMCPPAPDSLGGFSCEKVAQISPPTDCPETDGGTP